MVLETLDLISGWPFAHEAGGGGGEDSYGSRHAKLCSTVTYSQEEACFSCKVLITAERCM